jgi:HEPN domain-containing protein
LQRKTDSHNPADWVYFAESDLAGVQVLTDLNVSYLLCQSKLAETLEKILKGELIRLGWTLIKTHDLQQLAKEIRARGSTMYPSCQSLCDSLAERYFTNRYPGFDLDEENWPTLKLQVQETVALLNQLKEQLPKDEN